MNKARINTNQEDGENRSLKGLKNKGIVDFWCSDCNSHLLVLQLTSTDGVDSSSVSTRIVVKCCLCGGFSPVKRVDGQFYPGATSDDMSFDVLDSDPNAPESDVLFKAWKK